MSRSAAVMEARSSTNLITMIQIPNCIISRKIAEGGCAEIYEGTDIDTKRKVAIKVLHTRHLNNKTEQKRMLNERRCLGYAAAPLPLSS